jgi:excisionase family DNA binding protein
MNDPEPLQDVLAHSRLLLTAEEAATVLRIGRTTVYALMKADDLHQVHIGRSCRLARAELERYVHQRRRPRRPRRWRRTRSEQCGRHDVGPTLPAARRRMPSSRLGSGAVDNSGPIHRLAGRSPHQPGPW